MFIFTMVVFGLPSIILSGGEDYSYSVMIFRSKRNLIVCRRALGKCERLEITIRLWLHLLMWKFLKVICFVLSVQIATKIHGDSGEATT